jgi:hypothetical protein
MRAGQAKGPRLEARTHDSLESDQETAMGLEQGHSRSRRAQPGHAERRPLGSLLNKLNVKRLADLFRHRGGTARLNAHGRTGLQHDAGWTAGRRGGGTIRHPTGTGFVIAAAATAVLGGPQIHRLHLRHGSAEQGDQKPDQAFHRTRHLSRRVEQATGYSPAATRCPGIGKKCKRRRERSGRG